MATGIRGQYYKYREFSLNLLSLYKQRADVQAFLEIILSLATLIIFVIFAIKPTILTMITLNKEIKTKQETLNGLNQKITDLQTANRVYRDNEAFIPDIDSAIFGIPSPETISEQVLRLGQKNSVTITGLSIGEVSLIGQSNSQKETVELPQLPGGAKSISVAINTKGSYSNLSTFLKDVENSRIPIKLDTLTISSSQLVSGDILGELINSRVPYFGKQ
jgi:hypothetical protein